MHVVELNIFFKILLGGGGYYRKAAKTLNPRLSPLVHVSGCLISKVGIRNFSPQFRGQPNRLRNCGPSKFDFRNSTQSPAGFATVLSSPFSSAQDSFYKSTKNIFRSVCKKNCLKFAEIFELYNCSLGHEQGQGQRHGQGQ